jgi:hypothetical protein
VGCNPSLRKESAFFRKGNPGTGQGFAVVADEVRRLAEQSSQSAQQLLGAFKVESGNRQKGWPLQGEVILFLHAGSFKMATNRSKRSVHFRDVPFTNDREKQS